MIQYLCSILHFSLIWLLFTCKITESDDTKIIGGRLANPGEFPYQLCMYGSYRCGGALISMARFITAAHCFIYKGKVLDISKQFMVAGVVDCNKKDDPFYQERGIVHYFIHPGYKNKKDRTSYHDFSVGILDKPFIESERVKAGSIPSKDPELFRQFWLEHLASGKTCTSMGYGAQIGKDGIHSMQWGNDIRVIDVTPKTDKYCKATLVYETDTKLDGEVCAVAVNPTNESMAPGDSGSGFACNGLLYGVNTGGLFMQGYNLQLYTLAYPYLDFFTKETAVSHSAHIILVIFGITVSLINFVHH